MSADIAFINANIKTQNSAHPIAQALAIQGNRITKVGSNQQIQPLISHTTKVLDIGGRTVVPGFIDTHIHVTDFGRCLLWLDLSETKSIADLQCLLKEKARKTPAGRWIIGQGWNETRFNEQRMPTIVDLDAAAPSNPVILYREAAMICVVNSLALKYAGIAEQTSVSQDDDIGTTNISKLTGVFHDSAVNLIWQAVPEPTEDEMISASTLACQRIFQAGITSIDWIVISESELSIIQRLYDSGLLLFRVNVVVPETLLKKAVNLKSVDPAVLRVGGAFIMADGYLDSKEAALQQPYSDDPENSGKMLLTQEQLMASVRRALTFGVQPVIHAMGDKAIDITLNVIEQIQTADIRFRIEQAALLNQSLIDRLKKQNIVVSIQPKVISTEFTVWSAKERLGDRARLLHPVKTLLDQGVRVAAGSDCPMEPLDVLLGIQELVTRTAYPEQKLSVDEAISLYTLNAAYCSGDEAIKGSVEEGKLADLIVLSADLDSVIPEKVGAVTVDFVVLNGCIMVVT